MNNNNKAGIVHKERALAFFGILKMYFDYRYNAPSLLQVQNAIELPVV